MANAAIRIEGPHLILFVDDTTPEEALWHGPTASRQEIAELIGADDAYPIACLADFVPGTATPPYPISDENALQTQLQKSQLPSQQQQLLTAIAEIRGFRG